MGELEAILEAAAACDARGEPYALATVVQVRGSSYRRPGARLLVPAEGAAVGVISGGCLEAEAARLARQAMTDDIPILLTIDHSAEGDELWGSGLGCRGVIDLLAEPPSMASETVAAIVAAQAGGTGVCLLTGLDGERQRLTEHEAEALGERGALAVGRGRPTLIGEAVLDPILPPTHLVVCSAGPDALPLVEAARRLGWRVTVADPRRRLLSSVRVPEVAVSDAPPAEAGAAIGVDGHSVVVLMSHDYVRDADYLAGMLGRHAAYLGILGPRERTERLLGELDQRGLRLSDEDGTALHAPAGLDIGADGPEEVAASVIAEILAVLHGHAGGPLRARSGPIHEP
jgi:xanthine dehydrogenase accessory factor